MKKLLVFLVFCLLSVRCASAGAGESRELYRLVDGNDTDGLRRSFAAGADVNAVFSENDEITLLHYAVMKHRPEIVLTLLRSGADIEAKSKIGTPLHVALLLSGEEPQDELRLKTLYVLLDNGAKLLALNEEGDTPLHAAVSGEHIEYALALARKLIALGADVNARNANGTTPLHHALNAAFDTHNQGVSRVAITRLLIDAGADIDARDREGWSALHYAVGDVESLVLLLEAGAETYSEGEELTPEAFALELGELEAAELLRRYTKPR